jgi:type I restriction enzyme R subunit
MNKPKSMSYQSEQALENKLIDQLTGLGYDRVSIHNESDLVLNLKAQLEKHNKIRLTDGEFARVLNHLNKGNIFEKAKILRDRMYLQRDDGTSAYLEFINHTEWCQNRFQVTNQVTMEGVYKNRYDVTLLINGLPLVQIELKRRGLELKEAFNQTIRYKKHSFGAGFGLYQYIQLFVISNGVNTKYYANNRKDALSYKQTFFWADPDNNKITNLSEFADQFLEACHLSKMITKYIVLAETYKILMVLRPYQHYATERIIDRVRNTQKNGYIWHTTGSGKTLTSFKASQLLVNLPDIHKVLFVVDRNDLDYQTTKEFNNFSEGSVDGTDNTKALVRQFSDDTKLIVTTIQKLNNAVSNRRYAKVMEPLREKKMVFIFDECHRSQFGETHKRIKAYFNKIQLFGFTGTPIFKENAYKNDQGKRTTKMLFDECLHKYVITDAIKDENVLKFSIEYVGRYKQKKHSLNYIEDVEVEGIDTEELFNDEGRLEKITDYIISNHARKTHQKTFTGMFCVSSVENLTRYYHLFRQKKAAGEHNLKLATIFSYAPNPDDPEVDTFWLQPDEFLEAAEPKVAYRALSGLRDQLESFIGDYNQEFNTNYTTKNSKSFYDYYKNISKRVKNREIDLLLVVNMFLTGFDSPPLNTLYVDKNLRYHGLIQAYSRTNRILGEKKSHGNIVAFRNLKERTDDAISLFSNKEAIEEILMKPYEDYIEEFDRALQKLNSIAPTVDVVNELESEEEEMEFVTSFRQLLRIKNVLASFADFTFDDLGLDEQTFEDYKSKYLDLYDKVKGESRKEKVSILDDVDFELELIHRDEINVSYILRLLAKLKESKGEEDYNKQRKEISKILGGTAILRSKKELIDKFIDENLIHISDTDDIEEAFESFWNYERAKAFNQLCEEENVQVERLQSVLDNYLFSEQPIARDDIIETLNEKPKLLQRKPIATRIIEKIMQFVEVFVEGVAA